MRAILDRLARAGRWFTSGPASAGPFFYPEWMSCRLTAEVARDKRLRSPLVAARSPRILPPFRRRGPHFKSCPHSGIAERQELGVGCNLNVSVDRPQAGGDLLSTRERGRRTQRRCLVMPTFKG